jgi:branched-chain amino acid transport system substrate-binding protein
MKRLITTLALAAIAATAGFAGAGAADPVRIGFSIAKTGIFAQAAPSQLNAYELWKEQVNAGGGLDIDGGEKRPIEFVVYDDQSNPTEAVRIYEKLVNDDNVDLLLAPWGTPTHFAIAGVVEKLKFPVVGNSAASVGLRELKPGYIWFPTSAIPDRMAEELVKMLQTQNAKSVAVLTNQLPFSLEIQKFLAPALEGAAIQVAVSQDYPPDIKDMTAMLTAVKAANPDAVLALSYPGDSIVYMNQARELGIEAPFQFVLVGPTIAFFGQMFGPALDGIVTIGHWTPAKTDWARAKPFFDAYVAKFNERPDYLDSALAYMSCEILQQAVAKAGLDREKIRDAIANDTFDTINGPVKFDGVQNAITPTSFLQFQAGEAQLVWPPESATAKFMPKPVWPK